MNEQRLRGLMGLCVRAGQGVFGEDSCLKTLRSGQAGILLLDSGISENADAKYSQICRREGIPFCRIPEGMILDAAGKPGMAMAVRKGGFAEQIASCIDGESPEGVEPEKQRKARQRRTLSEEPSGERARTQGKDTASAAGVREKE